MFLAQFPFGQRECQQFVSIEGRILHGVTQYVSNEFRAGIVSPTLPHVVDLLEKQLGKPSAGSQPGTKDIFAIGIIYYIEPITGAVDSTDIPAP